MAAATALSVWLVQMLEDAFSRRMSCSRVRRGRGGWGEAGGERRGGGGLRLVGEAHRFGVILDDSEVVGLGEQDRSRGRRGIGCPNGAPVQEGGFDDLDVPGSAEGVQDLPGTRVDPT